MFKSKSGSGKINPDTTDTLIGEGTIFEGKLRSEASIRIEGSIIGDISSNGDVIIGENGVANSNLSARDLVLAGQLNGDAEIRGKLTISSTGVLNGNITAASLIIESGGVFNGSCKVTSTKPEAVQPVKATS